MLFSLSVFDEFKRMNARQVKCYLNVALFNYSDKNNTI